MIARTFPLHCALWTRFKSNTATTTPNPQKALKMRKRRKMPRLTRPAGALFRSTGEGGFRESPEFIPEEIVSNRDLSRTTLAFVNWMRRSHRPTCSFSIAKRSLFGRRAPTTCTKASPLGGHCSNSSGGFICVMSSFWNIESEVNKIHSGKGCSGAPVLVRKHLENEPHKGCPQFEAGLIPIGLCANSRQMEDRFYWHRMAANCGKSTENKGIHCCRSLFHQGQ